MLVKQNILSAEDGKAITDGLEQIAGEIERGDFAFSAALEDIHMNIENRLKEIIGDAAGRLHTARSRNDQVATGYRLWMRSACENIINNINVLKSVLNQFLKIIIPVSCPALRTLRRSRSR